MRRKLARPYGQSVTGYRLVSMLMGTLVLWMLYDRLKDPATWRGFVDAKENPRAAEHDDATPTEAETIVTGPNDLDESEVNEINRLFELVVDRAPLKPREMDAYWRLIDWSRTESFRKLEARSREDVPFTQLWEQPEKYRGKPIQLRLNVRRTLLYDAPENPSGIKTVCEAWGWTDESRSFPYCVVFADPPKDLPIGTDIRAEIHFVGYFLKVMTYTAFDHARGAPLLLGRAKLVPKSTGVGQAKANSQEFVLAIVLGTIMIGVSFFVGILWRKKPKKSMLPQVLSVEASAGSELDKPFAQIAADQNGTGLPFDFQYRPTTQKE